MGDAEDGYAAGTDILKTGSRGTGEGVDTGERWQKVSLVGQSRLPSRVRIIAWGVEGNLSQYCVYVRAGVTD